MSLVAQVSQRSYRILFVTGAYPSSEHPHSGTFIKSQAQSLISAGHSVDLLCPNPRWPMPARYLWASWLVFWKTLRGHYDIVHAHFGLWCLAARCQWTTPVVASFLGDDLLGEPLASGGWSKRAQLVVWVSRLLCHLVDAVIVKSEGMKQAARFSAAFVIPNGVDFSLFYPISRQMARATLGWHPDRLYVLFGNRPSLVGKRFSLAQEAVHCLQQRGVAVELVVAAGLPQEQVLLYLNAANALILSSLKEGSPNVVKEAMACNVPVVATDVGDVSQVIGQTQGCAVCASTPDALADGLQLALAHTEPTTGRAAIAHLENSQIVPRILAVYAYAGRRKFRRLSLLKSRHVQNSGEQTVTW
ncbi:MAG TPA: glycosyltransferase [Ktedonobacteraceae bacterium]|jgi:teichuronic acid biosynthesis glycosyltransferase TuaC|nr:glycosyltransferase [Ktedonobacteraceae bacterium]